jgi:hypothetical protein
MAQPKDFIINCMNGGTLKYYCDNIKCISKDNCDYYKNYLVIKNDTLN